MSQTPISRTTVNEQDRTIEQILESTVVVSWPDLMHGRSGLVDVEYGLSPSGTLDYVQLWSSIKRGYWLLACTYRMSASKSEAAGVHFDNGYKSDSLAHNLEVVMQHQNVFDLPHNSGRQRSLQIVTPTENESKAAAVSMANAFDRFKSDARPLLPSESERVLLPTA